MAANITKVYLANVPLENDYAHSIYWGNADAQINYFKGKSLLSFENFSYQRKDGIIRVPENFDTLLNLHINYVFYQNTAYSNKWFFAFVNDIKYVDDGRTDLEIETDVIQTWYFDYVLKDSFVEREHVTSDAIGEHTVPEGLELGEYICNEKYWNAELVDTALVVASTVVPSEGNVSVGAIYHGIYSGVKYYTYSSANMTTNIQFVTDSAGTEAITGIFYAPRFLLSGSGGPINESDSPAKFDIEYSKIDKLDGYTPKNKKMLTYPFCYILASNGTAGQAVYHQEKFNSISSINFRVYGALTPGCSIRMCPMEYNGIAINTEEGLNLGKYPQCNWATDMFTNWLTQNAVNVATGIAGGAAAMVGGAGLIATGAGAGAGASAMLSGFSAIASSLNEVKKADMVPPQTSGNLNCGDVIAATGNNTFMLFKMTIKKEYAKIIDKYFDMFGYKVNMVKTPNENHRENYWFTKCLDVNIDGGVPSKDMQKIKDCYNRGITFWKNPANIQNYNVSNNII